MSDTYEAVWQQFREHGKVANHWDNWSARWIGQSSYTAYLISVADQPAIVEAVKTVQRCLPAHLADRVPEHALHITVQELGFQSQLSSSEIRTMITDGQQALQAVEPFTLRIGNANSFPVAAFLEVEDQGALYQVRARLRRALPWLSEEGRDPHFQDGHDRYLPHLSIAYYNSEADNSQIVAALEPFRSYAAGAVTVTHLQITKVLPPVKDYRWRVEAVCTLGPPPAAPTGRLSPSIMEGEGR